MLSSCGDQFGNIEAYSESAGTVLSAADLEQIEATIDNESLNRSIPGATYMSPFDYNAVFGKGSRMAAPMVWTLFGPYTISSTLTKVETNKKIVLLGGEAPGYGPGVYFADIWECKASVTLPAGDFFMRTGSSKVGYKHYYSGTFEEGIVDISEDAGSNKIHTMKTYSYVLKFNASGNPVSQVVIPRDLTGTTFTYQYMRDL